jgi:hypothetical protein
MTESSDPRKNQKWPFKSFGDKDYKRRYPGEEATNGAMTASRLYTSTSAPTANNDSRDTAGIAQHFAVGDRWHWTTQNVFYELIDATVGAAVWKEVDPLITVSREYGPSFWAQAFGEETPEHTNQTGSYDHTGGAFENLFTKTSGDDFTQADEDNGNWILLTGANYGAIAEIKNYIDANNVVVQGFGTFITGDGHHHEFSVAADGIFEVVAYDFTGKYVAEIELDSAADDTDGLKVEAKANGYTSVQSIIIDYIAGALGAGETGGGIGVRLDVTEATSADATTEIDSIICVIIDGTSATTSALKVLPGFTNALVVQGA